MNVSQMMNAGGPNCYAEKRRRKVEDRRRKAAAMPEARRWPATVTSPIQRWSEGDHEVCSQPGELAWSLSDRLNHGVARHQLWKA
jgi:hypothetical protein